MFRAQPIGRVHLIPIIAVLIASPLNARAVGMSVCDDVLHSTGTFKITSQTQQTNLQQKSGLCQAAAAADNAAQLQHQAAMVWFGVGAVCTLVCIHQNENGKMNEAEQIVCQGANMAAGANDKMADQKAKDFQDQLKAASAIEQVKGPQPQQSGQPVVPAIPTPKPVIQQPFKTSVEKLWREFREATLALSLIEYAYAGNYTGVDAGGNNPSGAGSTTPPAGGGAGGAGDHLPINKDACMAALQAAFTGYQKDQAAQSQEQTRDQNLAAASQLNLNADPAQNVAGISGGLGARPTFDSGAGVTPEAASAAKSSDGGVAGGKAPSSTGSGSCANAGDSAAVIACVSKKDPSLPAGVNDPAFQDQFAKQTGKDLGDLVKSGQSPSALAPGLMGSGLSKDEARSIVSAATAALGKGIADDMNKGADASSVASKDSGAGTPPAETPSFDTAATTPPATATAEFERKPAATVGGKLTLFEIVTQRYHACLDRVEKLSWSTPYNRLVHAEKAPQKQK